MRLSVCAPHTGIRPMTGLACANTDKRKSASSAHRGPSPQSRSPGMGLQPPVCLPGPQEAPHHSLPPTHAWGSEPGPAGYAGLCSRRPGLERASSLQFCRPLVSLAGGLPPGLGLRQLAVGWACGCPSPPPPRTQGRPFGMPQEQIASPSANTPPGTARLGEGGTQLPSLRG